MRLEENDPFEILSNYQAVILLHSLLSSPSFLPRMPSFLPRKLRDRKRELDRDPLLERLLHLYKTLLLCSFFPLTCSHSRRPWLKINKMEVSFRQLNICVYYVRVSCLIVKSVRLPYIEISLWGPLRLVRQLFENKWLRLRECTSVNDVASVKETMKGPWLKLNKMEVSFR